MRLVDHEPRAEAPAQVGDLRQRRDVALHREHAVDDDEDPAAVLLRLAERALELVHLVVAKRAQLRAAEDAAVHDRRVDAGVDDDRVAGGQQRPQRGEVGLRAGRADERLLGAHPLGDLLLELEVQGDRAVEQPRAGQARPELVQGVGGTLDDALVAGEAEVVVRAEHDPLGALHLDDRARGALERAEIRQQVGVARHAQLLGALMAAGLGEDVLCRGGHVA